MKDKTKYLILDFGLVLGKPKTGNWFITPNFYEIIGKNKIDLKRLNVLFNKYNENISKKIITKEEQYKAFKEFYLNILNDEVAKLSVEIYLLRRKFLDNINMFIDKIYYEIMGMQGLKIKYISNIDYFEDKKEMVDKFREKIDKYLEKEMLYKISLIGPHRDDFIFVLNDKNIALYGSQGQLRSVILALKLSEIELFKQSGDDDPILLLDDIFSELDLDKKNNLIKYINNNIQTIITTTDINMIDENLVKKANIFEIKNGKLFPGK